MADVVEKQLATQQEARDHEANLRSDIEGLRVELKRDIENLRKDVEMLRLESKRDIDVLRAEMKKDIAETHRVIAETKAELIRWVVGVSILQTTLIVGILARLAKLI